MTVVPPFAAFAPAIRDLSPLRRTIAEARCRDETACLAPLLEAASLPADTRAAIRETATKLVTTLRAERKGGGVEDLVQEYALSSQEGVALMCLAERSEEHTAELQSLMRTSYA